MIDNPLRIMLFMWFVSGFMLAGQLVLADEYGLTLRAPDGTELKPELLKLWDEDEINDTTLKITAGTNGSWNRVDDGDRSFFFMGWELIELLSGTYAFNLLLLFGLPQVIVDIAAVAYYLMLARAAIGYLRRG